MTRKILGNPTPIRTKFGITAALVAAVAIAGLTMTPALAASPDAADTSLPKQTVAQTGMFADDLKPRIDADSDRRAVELGVRFTPSTSGTVTALQYYQGPKATGTNTVTLWSGSGTVLASASFSSSSTPGWRTVPLKSAVPLTAGKTYVASYNAPNGGYPVTEQVFTQKKILNGFAVHPGAGVYRYGSTEQMPTASYKGSNYLVDVVFRAGSTDTTPPVTPTPEPTPPVEPETEPTPPVEPETEPTPPVDSKPDPTPPPTTDAGGFVVQGRSFPSSATTGVPAGTVLSPYTGPCTISASDVVIDGKTVDCYLRITGKNVQIKNSVLNGAIHSNSGSFSVTDSEIRLSATEDTGVGESNFTLTRVEITGGRRSVNCASNCTVEDSYIHSQGKDPSGQAHQSGIRMGANSVIRHNSITCDAPASAPAGGCSATLTGYGDFAVVQKNTIDNNLFLPGTGGYCAYGGSTTGKPYSSGVNNIKFTNNIWQRGKTGVCGIWGPIVSFDKSASGNVWDNNIWDDGKVIKP